MHTITLGSTGITAQFNGFGALPVQRVDTETAVRLLRKAYAAGINYYDTARIYSDSEEKLGLAFGDAGIRDKIFLATKTGANTPERFWQDLERSLSLLKTDCVDVYQFHNPPRLYRPGDGTGMYECMLEAKAQGKIRHIGFTSHSLTIANECVESGLYETLQFPFSYLSGDADRALVEKCAAHNMGFIAMKGLSGGLITNSAAAYAAIAEAKTVLPIWGIQKETELDEFISYISDPPQMTPELRAVIERDRAELTGNFCRGCGYCLPCTAGIYIPTAARMSLLLRRSPWQPLLSEREQEGMRKIEDCVDCGLCVSRCPYGLDTPALLRRNYEDYKKVLSGEVSVAVQKAES